MAPYKKLLIILTILLVIFLIGCKKDTTITITEDSKVEQEQPSAAKGCKSFVQPSNVQLIASDSWYNDCVSQASGSYDPEICTTSHEFSKAVLANDLVKFDSLSAEYINKHKGEEPLLSERRIYTQDFAIINKRQEVCDKMWSQAQIGGSVFKDIRKNEIIMCKASSSGDSNICSEISGDNVESDKITCQARAKRDPTLCENVTFNKQGCLATVCGWE